MDTVKSEILDCPNCCDKSYSQLLQEISKLKETIANFKCWLGRIPEELRIKENAQDGLIQITKLWLRSIPAEWSTGKVAAILDTAELQHANDKTDQDTSSSSILYPKVSLVQEENGSGEMGPLGERDSHFCLVYGKDDARATGKRHRSGSGGQGRKSKKRCASSAEEDEFEYTTAPPVAKKCDLCGESFPDSKFKRHFSLTHTLPCSVCELMFVGQVEKTAHERKEHFLANSNSKKFVNYEVKCEKCRKVFHNEDLCNEHYKQAHNLESVQDSPVVIPLGAIKATAAEVLIKRGRGLPKKKSPDPPVQVEPVAPISAEVLSVKADRELKTEPEPPPSPHQLSAESNGNFRPSESFGLAKERGRRSRYSLDQPVSIELNPSPSVNCPRERRDSVASRKIPDAQAEADTVKKSLNETEEVQQNAKSAVFIFQKEKVETCPKCLQFFKASIFKKHLMKKHSIFCDKCSFCCIAKSELLSHEATVHKEQRKELYICDICKNYVVKKSRVHHSKQPHKAICSICSLNLSGLSSLLQHMMTKHRHMLSLDTLVQSTPHSSGLRGEKMDHTAPHDSATRDAVHRISGIEEEKVVLDPNNSDFEEEKVLLAAPQSSGIKEENLVLLPPNIKEEKEDTPDIVIKDELEPFRRELDQAMRTTGRARNMSKGFRRTSIEEKIDNSTNVNFGSFSENASLIQEDGPYLSTGNLSLRMDDFSHPLKSEPTFNNDLMVAEPSILSPSEDI